MSRGQFVLQARRICRVGQSTNCPLDGWLCTICPFDGSDGWASVAAHDVDIGGAHEREPVTEADLVVAVLAHDIDVVIGRRCRERLGLVVVRRHGEVGHGVPLPRREGVLQRRQRLNRDGGR